MSSFFLYFMSILYIVAGINHFIHPKFYLRIIPDWIPNHGLVNYASGACEIIFAILLIPAMTRSIAAWLIIALLIAVFPANIKMCIDYYNHSNSYFWITVIRLPLQFLLIWWAWIYTK